MKGPPVQINRGCKAQALEVASGLMLVWTSSGLYCSLGGFHIDPHRPVDLALITHAHSDHARRGSKRYLCADSSRRLVQQRLGGKAVVESIPFGKKIQLGQVRVSFHPAGHILGSAQIRVESESSVWVASGDYKREADPSCEPFEIVPCDTYVTETTFAEPIYKWGESRDVGGEVLEWWRQNKSQGLNSVLHCYALGKTQRILAELAGRVSEPVYLFGEANVITECYRQEGVELAPTMDLESVRVDQRVEGALVIATHAIGKTEWMRRLENPETAFASGWTQTRRFGSSGFTISDHADWPALLRTIEETRCKQVFTLQSNTGTLVKELRRRGLIARPMLPIRSGSGEARNQISHQGELFAW